MILAQSIIIAAQIYAAIGVVVAVLFVVIGLGRIELAARGAFLFRLQIIPGLILLWPVVLARWIELERAGEKQAIDAEEAAAEQEHSEGKS